jgi:DNA invertase Pin-like site-specific DNA recombinase
MPTNNGGRQAVVYVRVRSIPADPERDQLAIERQRQACEAFCAEQGIDITDVLVNADIARIPGGSLVVCYELSRLTRRVIDLAALLDRDVQVATVTDGEIPDTAALRLQLAAMTAEAEGPRHHDGWSDEAMRWRPTP